jgi:hypothetical protein
VVACREADDGALAPEAGEVPGRPPSVLESIEAHLRRHDAAGHAAGLLPALGAPAAAGADTA